MCELIIYPNITSSIGSVLPEVMLSLLLVQMKNPSIAHFADLDDSLTSLLEELNNFTRTSSNAAKEEDGEMMWERFWGAYILKYIHAASKRISININPVLLLCQS